MVFTVGIRTWHVAPISAIALAVVGIAAPRASAVRPIAHGRYELRTPEACDWPGLRPQDPCTYGAGWPVHVFRRADRFAPVSYLEFSLDCSPWDS
jgi:hypothetical protein